MSDKYDLYEKYILSIFCIKYIVLKSNSQTDKNSESLIILNV